jgi:DNA-binding transcriptional regulator YhcF (GntR family)
MPLHLHIQSGEDIPIYRQLVRQVEVAVITGRVSPGERLPSQRELAQELVIAPLTVKRSYDELEANGYLKMERGRGTFACAPPQKHSELADAELKSAMRRVLELAWQNQIPLAEILKNLTAEESTYREELESQNPSGSQNQPPTS